MDKLKRFLYIPLAFHIAVFITMIFMEITANRALIFTVLLDYCGVVICPVFMAVLSIAHAIVHEGKVFDYFKISVIYLLIIGGLRIVLYAVFATGTVYVALLCVPVSLGVYGLWTAAFALTDHMMKNKKKGKKSKKKDKKK